MPLTPTPVPAYPNVPQAPGVPSVKRNPLQTISVIQLVLADVGSVVNMFLEPQWGIFGIDGTPWVIPDTILSVDFRGEARISDYPVEGGGFESYDKVILPYDVRVEMVCTGNQMDKTVFITALENARKSLQLFVVATPEVTFPNVNVVHYDMRRTRHRGATIIFAEVWLEQVVQATTTQFASSQTSPATPQAPPLTNTADPISQSDVNQGTVQPQAAPLGLPVPPIPPFNGGADASIEISASTPHVTSGTGFVGH